MDNKNVGEVWVHNVTKYSSTIVDIGQYGDAVAMWNGEIIYWLREAQLEIEYTKEMPR